MEVEAWEAKLLQKAPTRKSLVIEATSTNAARLRPEQKQITNKLLTAGNLSVQK